MQDTGNIGCLRGREPGGRGMVWKGDGLGWAKRVVYVVINVSGTV